MLVQSDSIIKEQSQIKLVTNIRCLCFQTASQFCINQKCDSQKNIFICSNQQCQCHMKHQPCEKAEIQNIKRKILLKMNNGTVSKDQIEKIFDRLIDKISDLRDKILLKLDQQKRNILFESLTILQRLFLNTLQSQQSPEWFSTHESIQVCRRLDSNISQVYNPFLENFKCSLVEYQADFNDIFAQYENRWDKLFAQLNDKQNIIQTQTKEEIKISRELGKISREILPYTNVIHDPKSLKDLIKLYKPQNVLGFKLLFKACQHEFRLEQYWERCSDETDTMFIVRSCKDKILGAYSPLSHNYKGIQLDHQSEIKQMEEPNQQGEFVADPTSTSFIFSLTNNDKFKLRNWSRAIYRSKSKKFIKFGGQSDQFLIQNGDLSKNQKSKCRSNVNWGDPRTKNANHKSSYYNRSYKGDWFLHDLRYSMIKLNGTETSDFQTQQWEVWKVFLDGKIEVEQELQQQVSQSNQEEENIILDQDQAQPLQIFNRLFNLFDEEDFPRLDTIRFREGHEN